MGPEGKEEREREQGLARERQGAVRKSAILTPGILDPVASELTSVRACIYTYIYIYE